MKYFIILILLFINGCAINWTSEPLDANDSVYDIVLERNGKKDMDFTESSALDRTEKELNVPKKPKYTCNTKNGFKISHTPC